MISVDRINGLSGDLAIKAPVRVATTANITLEGLQTIDGVALAADDRVFVWKQTNAVENGIWIANTSAWSRARDFDGRFDAVQGTRIPVVSGTLYGTGVFQLTTASPVIGTTALSFSAANDLNLAADLLSTASGKGAALVGFKNTGAGAVARTAQAKLLEVASVEDNGAIGNGVANDSSSINSAADDYGTVSVPSGTYLYTAATTVDPSKLDFGEGASFVGMATGNTVISVRDKAGKFIGLQHNYNETTAVGSPITTGDFISPPVSDAQSVTGVDVIAHLFNDFGLESTRAAGGGLGSTKWYSWQWNHTTATADGPYDPKRHPLLGWYRGDDPTALDWICYWLREAGVTGVHLTLNAIDTSTWSTNSDPNHWVYQLFNNVPNFRSLKYVMGGYVTASQAAWEASWTDVQTNILDVYRNYHVTTIDGKTYGTIYIFDMGTARTGIFGSTPAFETWLKSMATFFQTHGHDGVCVLARNGSFYTGSSVTTIKNTKTVLNDFGVYVFESDYGAFSGTYVGPTVYQDYVDDFSAAYDAVKFRHIPNVMTSRESKFHPSGFTTTGSTPALFSKVVQIAANAAIANETIPNIITVYNVSEWGEGGASLQPNVYDGFGYLDGIRKLGGSNNAKIKDLSSDLFSGETAVKIGTASDAVLFSPFTFTVTSPHSISMCEVEFAAMDNSGHFAAITRKYVFALYNTGGTLTASAINSDAGNLTDRSNANYVITPTVGVTIVDPTTATFDVTLTKGGALGWATCEFVTKGRIISVDPTAVVLS